MALLSGADRGVMEEAQPGGSDLCGRVNMASLSLYAKPSRSWRAARPSIAPSDE